MINDNNKNSWCVNAYHALSGMNNGTTKICCMHKPEEHSMTLGNEPISEHFHKKEIKKIRKALQNGDRHYGCRLCWEEEDAGRKSKRIRDNERYLNEIENGERHPYEGLAKVELNLGNTCNISCRTCLPEVSSGWIKESYETQERGVGLSFKDFAKTLRTYHMSYDENSPFWNDIEQYLPTIKQFDFYGGEPFMSKKMWSLLGKAVDTGVSKEIELHYNTNGTHWPEEVKYWKHFKKINLSFSIDGIEKQFEYMRYPAKWDLVKQTINNAKELAKKYGNISISWCVTISTLNVYDLPQTLDYWRKHHSDIGLYLNLVHGPEEYNIKNLPENIKPLVIDKLNTVPKEDEKSWQYLPGIINFMNSVISNDTAWQQFLDRTQLHDKYRKQMFKLVFPEYAGILNE